MDQDSNETDKDIPTNVLPQKQFLDAKQFFDESPSGVDYFISKEKKKSHKRRNTLSVASLPSVKQSREKDKPKYGLRHQSVSTLDIESMRSKIKNGKIPFYKKILNFAFGKSRNSTKLKKAWTEDDLKSLIEPDLVNKKIQFQNGTYEGTVYEQESVLDGKMITLHGKGKYYFNIGSVYEGDFKCNKKSGYGKYIYKNGNTFEGEFEDNHPNGVGVYTFSNKSKYEGHFVDGYFDGSGVMYWPSEGKNDWKVKYKGTFLKNKRNGFGTYFHKEGSIYSGFYKDNNRHGLGVFIFQDGREWVGWFKENKREKEYILHMLQEIGLESYYDSLEERGFTLSMIKVVKDELELEIFLEIIFGDIDKLKVIDYIEKNKEQILNVFRDLSVDDIVRDHIDDLDALIVPGCTSEQKSSSYKVSTYRGLGTVPSFESLKDLYKMSSNGSFDELNEFDDDQSDPFSYGFSKIMSHDDLKLLSEITEKNLL